MTRSFSPRAVPTFCTTFCLAAAAIAVFSISGGCDTAAQNLGNGGTRGEGPAGNPAPPGAPANFGDGAEADDASGGPAAAATVARAIEEADIVKVVGDKLYALNQFKGLLIVDVQDPDSPALLGELDLRGRGVEMYVGDTQAYVLLSADSYYYYAGGHGFAEGGVAVDGDDTATSIARDGPMPPAPDFEGSRLAIVDISDPTEPVVDGKINLVGFANESRRVGDIIYVIGSHYAPYFAYGAEDSSSEGQGFVASVNVADPDDIVAVERKSLAGNALMMHTSDSAIFAASQSYDYDSGDTMTDIEILDISDAAGAIALRGTFQVPGYIRNRFYMDAFGDTFRIASESTGFGFRKVRLFTYDISDLDDVADLGSTDIIEDESLQAVRFDGERAYAVTFLQIDPLFVIDLSDPANPVVAGELEVPGFSTHIEPRGNRLIAVGIDDTDGNRPAVAYYNVEDPANPTQIGRVILGPPGSYTSSDATYDEKAFKVVDELGLIAIPFQHVDYGDFGDERSVPPSEPVAQAEEDGEDGDKPDELPEYQGPTCTNGVQLVDFSDAELKQRGSFENSGNVTRVGIIGGRVFAISEFGLKTVDITDRDHP
ncbi:MAG TPA: beta-propeller domain-containing protein, partial [Phycisphaerae bacterium]|nr:beta-propeller domain-containing protein [Phycisphaerae bacterium]